jgi:predicted metal-dependent phosphoesterase TrpH
VIVDLHLHTTASDGRLAPRALVERVAAAGVTVMAVTDHDTTAACADVAAAASALGIEAVPGIEITAVEQGGDVHILGYFFDPADAALAAFLAVQRQRRVARVEAIAARLASLGLPVDVTALLADARRQSGRSIGRPQVAAAMVAAGHARDTREAFDRWLGNDGPGFVPREGPPIVAVVDAIHTAGGLASLAHPGKTRIDNRIPALREAGLDAIEVFHPGHDAGASDFYARTAIDLGYLVTGGSDYHGDPAHGVEPGVSSLPAHLWERLREAAGSRA